MYPLLETIKIADGKPQNLVRHIARMQRSHQILFKDTCPHNLASALDNIPETFARGLVKCRFMYGLADFQLEFQHYLPRKIQSLQLIHCNSINYALKYTDRSELASLLLQRHSCDDILIIKNGCVTDTSFSNIAFFDGLHWYTPTTPLLKGTKREQLLDEGIIQETEIRVIHLSHFRSYRLINAMLDFQEQSPQPIEGILSYCFQKKICGNI